MEARNDKKAFGVGKGRHVRKLDGALVCVDNCLKPGAESELAG